MFTPGLSILSQPVLLVFMLLNDPCSRFTCSLLGIVLCSGPSSLFVSVQAHHLSLSLFRTIISLCLCSGPSSLFVSVQSHHLSLSRFRTIISLCLLSGPLSLFVPVQAHHLSLSQFRTIISRCLCSGPLSLFVSVQNHHLFLCSGISSSLFIFLQNTVGPVFFHSAVASAGLDLTLQSVSGISFGNLATWCRVS